MAKRNRITAELSQTIAESAPLVKMVPKQITIDGSETHADIEISKLIHNPFQPRIEMDSNELSELVQSIEKNGLLQPILVTSNHNGKYTILAGHRRAEAFKILGKEKIPCMLKNDVSRQDMAVFAIAENAVRVDLNPIEFAISIRHLLDEGVVESQNKLAENIGLSKGHVSKLMSILKLPADIIKIIKEDNYNIVYILSILNKVAPEKIEEAYKEIKYLARDEAENVLKTKYLSKGKDTTVLPIFKAKQTKDKIKIDINIAGMNEAKILQLNEAIKKMIADFE
jgi:ParB family chromosome partitioning protein